MLVNQGLVRLIKSLLRIVGLMVNLKMGQIKNEFILIIVVWFTIVCELVHLVDWLILTFQGFIYK